MTGAVARRVRGPIVAAGLAVALSACADQPNVAASADLGPRVIEPRARAALLGRAPAELAAVLGDPLLLRREPSSAYARFLADACVLDVFLHEHDSPRGLLARHVEVRPATARDPKACQRLEARLRRVTGSADMRRV